MSDVLKVLGQIAAASATEEDLYTVPNLALTTASSIIICNRTASPLTFRVSVAVAGAATADKDFIFYDAPIPGNSTVTAVVGMTMNQSDVVRTYASGTGLSFNLFGVETS